jgi:hypothetical protein
MTAPLRVTEAFTVAEALTVSEGLTVTKVSRVTELVPFPVARATAQAACHKVTKLPPL